MAESNRFFCFTSSAGTNQHQSLYALVVGRGHSASGGNRTRASGMGTRHATTHATEASLRQYRWLGSNQRPSPYEGDALSPTELHRRSSYRLVSLTNQTP